MNFPASWKTVQITPPAAAIASGAVTTGAVDTQGSYEIGFLLSFGAIDITLSTLKIQESDDSGMSGATDISGTDLSASVAATDDNKNMLWVVRKDGGRKRYMDLQATFGSGTTNYVCINAILLMNKTPTTNAERGVLASAFVN